MLAALLLRRSAVLILLAALVGPVAAQHVGESQTLRPPGPLREQTLYGYVLASTDDVLVVGASLENDTAPTAPPSGAAYVYERPGGPGTPWALATRLGPEPADDNIVFGFLVTLDPRATGGPHLLVSAVPYYREEPGGGAVFVYARVGGAWTRVDTLLAAETVEGDYFGWAVAIEGDVLVVGAPGAFRRGGESAGEAYVFERAGLGNPWAQVATLSPEELRPHDNFGLSAWVLSPTRVAIGAPLARVAGRDQAGVLYLYEREPEGTWALFRKTYPPEDEWIVGRNFGRGEGQTAFHRGDLLQLGKTFAQSTAPLRLRRYRLVGADTTWTRIEPPFPVTYPGVEIGEVRWGELLLRGDTMVATTFVRPPEPAFADGLSFLYSYDADGPPGEDWALRATFARAAGGPDAPDLGWSGALTGTDLFLGSLANDPGEIGAVAVFDLPEIVPAEPPPLPPAALSLRVAPNPAARGAGALHLSLAAPGVARVAVYDALGRAVALLHDGPLGAGPIRLPLPPLPPAVYLARAVTPAGSVVARFAVAR
jgi:hypothetical protein